MNTNCAVDFSKSEMQTVLFGDEHCEALNVPSRIWCVMFLLPRLKPTLPFVSWNQEGWKTGLCSVPPVGHSHSLLALANNTCMKPTLMELRERFTRLYRKKVHLKSFCVLYHFRPRKPFFIKWSHQMFLGKCQIQEFSCLFFSTVFWIIWGFLIVGQTVLADWRFHRLFLTRYRLNAVI